MYKTKTLIQIISLPALLLFMFGAFFLLSTKQVSAQAATIECTTGRFLSQSQTNSQLNLLNFNVTPATLDPIGPTYADGYNAIGYNIADMYLYGYDSTNNEFAQIDGAGGVTLIGNGTTPVLSPGNYAAGDIDADGDHNMLSYTDQDGTSNVNQWVITDVSGVVASTVTSFTLTNDIVGGLAVGDVAFNPADGKFYGVDVVNNRLVMIDINKVGSTGTVTHFGPVQSQLSGPHGAAYINSKGQLITVQNNPGRLYRYEIGINGSGSGAATLLSNSPNVDQTDGASCPVVPLIEKIASPKEIEQGGTVTYTYTIYNPLTSSILTADFEDVLEAGLTYVEDTLSDDLGGTPNSYGGTNTLTISGINIPAGGTVEIEIDVAIASDAEPGTVYNQACINNFNITSLVSEVCSDYPVTNVFGDETPLLILPPAAPDTGFAMFKDNSVAIMALTSVLALAIVVIAKRLNTKRI
ncbi:MAG: DUF11 domain-containing protein [bacterium]|nr:DUF11 domain-containing protein [bacterium]